MHPDNIVNIDETNFYFDSPSPKTIAKKGAKTVSLLKNGTSGRCTVLLAVTLSGIKLPAFVIFKGTPGATVEKEFDKLDYPKDTFFAVQKKAWNDTEVMLQWIEKVWKPFFAKSNEKKMLIMDTVGVHEVEKCMEKISAENTIIHWIDAGSKTE